MSENRLPEPSSAGGERTMHIVKGEKDATALHGIGLCTIMNAGSAEVLTRTDVVLAHAVRVSPDTLRRMLSGSRSCSFALANRLAAYGVCLNNIGDRRRPATRCTDLARASVVRNGDGRANVRSTD